MSAIKIKDVESEATTSSRVSAMTQVALALPEHLLFRHDLLSGVNQAKLAPVLERISIRRAPKGTSLNDPATRGGSLNLVLSGCLKSYQINADGDLLVLELIEAGGLDGLLRVAGLGGHFSEAAEDSLVAMITPATLERMMALDPRVGSNLLRIMSARLVARENQLQAMAVHDPLRRIATLLLAMAAGSGGPNRGANVTIRRLTHATLGDMLGLRAMVAALQLRRLVELGAVTATTEWLRLDVEGLRRAIEMPVNRPTRS